MIEDCRWPGGAQRILGSEGGRQRTDDRPIAGNTPRLFGPMNLRKSSPTTRSLQRAQSEALFRAPRDVCERRPTPSP
jgi:hypothetical protein